VFRGGTCLMLLLLLLADSKPAMSRRESDISDSQLGLAWRHPPLGSPGCEPDTPGSREAGARGKKRGTRGQPRPRQMPNRVIVVSNRLPVTAPSSDLVRSIREPGRGMSRRVGD